MSVLNELIIHPQVMLFNLVFPPPLIYGSESRLWHSLSEQTEASKITQVLCSEVEEFYFLVKLSMWFLAVILRCLRNTGPGQQSFSGPEGEPASKPACGAGYCPSADSPPTLGSPVGPNTQSRSRICSPTMSMAAEALMELPAESTNIWGMSFPK